jgi:putative hydrolase of the HAD superfamily
VLILLDKMRNFDAVTLDLWDTLVQEVPRKNPRLADQRVADIQANLRGIGRVYETADLERAYRLSGEFCDSVWAENRDMPVDEHLGFMLYALDPGLARSLKAEEYQGIRKIYAEAILRHPPVLMEGALSTLESLSAKGYRLGLISNTGRTPGVVLRTALAKLGIDRFFNCMIFSDEVYVRKPEKEIFHEALGWLNSLPSKTVHIGNDRKDDFDGARGAGMNSILLDRSGKAERSAEVVHSLPEIIRLL